jgi:hypothetical protein
MAAKGGGGGGGACPSSPGMAINQPSTLPSILPSFPSSIVPSIPLYTSSDLAYTHVVKNDDPKPVSNIKLDDSIFG